MITGTIHTAKELDEVTLEKIAGKFERLLGERVDFEIDIDPSLLGGVNIEIAGRMYDGSLKGQLVHVLKTLKDQES